jgi:hypothetical protein
VKDPTLHRRKKSGRCLFSKDPANLPHNGIVVPNPYPCKEMAGNLAFGDFVLFNIHVRSWLHDYIVDHRYWFNKIILIGPIKNEAHQDPGANSASDVKPKPIHFINVVAVTLLYTPNAPRIANTHSGIAGRLKAPEAALYAAIRTAITPAQTALLKYHGFVPVASAIFTSRLFVGYGKSTSFYT